MNGQKTMTSEGGVALPDTHTQDAGYTPALVMPSVKIMQAKPIYRCRQCGQTHCAGHIPRSEPEKEL